MAINPKGNDKANMVPSPPHRQTARSDHNREASQLENDPHFIQPKPKK